MVPERAASMENPRELDEDGAVNRGGSTRVNGEEDVLRRFRMPTRFRVGLRPAGADSGVEREVWVSSLRIWERAARIGRRGDTEGLTKEESEGAVIGVGVKK